jgi:predicted RecA/RadA family phage recombinase
MPLNANALLIDPGDNVAVALADIAAGSAVILSGAASLVAGEAVPFAHKIAVRRIPAGEAILKYGVPIAFATGDIRAGAWVHEHNAKSYFVAKKEAQGA